MAGVPRLGTLNAGVVGSGRIGQEVPASSWPWRPAAGRLGGAALDLLTVEPPAPGAALARLPNVILTPHVAWVATQAVADLQRLAAEEVRRVLKGQRPRWLVNPEAWSGLEGQIP